MRISANNAQQMLEMEENNVAIRNADLSTVCVSFHESRSSVPSICPWKGGEEGDSSREGKRQVPRERIKIWEPKMSLVNFQALVSRGYPGLFLCH